MMVGHNKARYDQPHPISTEKKFDPNVLPNLMECVKTKLSEKKILYFNLKFKNKEYDSNKNKQNIC